MTSSGNNRKHILVYPFPALGHIIPLLDLTHLLLARGLTVTVLVTPNHLPLLQPLLSTHPSSSIQPLVLSPPDPPASSQSSAITRLVALGKLYDPVLQWFQSHPSPPFAIIYDFFLVWTNQLASKLGVRRVVFWPSGALASSMCTCMWRNLPKNEEPDDDNFLVTFPKIPNSPTFPWWQLSALYRDYKEGDPDSEFFRNGFLANLTSWGVVFNSFTELERVYIEHVKKEMGHDRVWAVGPVLPPAEHSSMGPTERGGSSAVPTHEVMAWLERKADDSVVYVCFGSRLMLTNTQMKVLATALECSKVHFIWCVQGTGGGHVASGSGQIPDGFEDRAEEGRGFIIRGWAPQVAILHHRAVGAFVTHCGWNSVLEGLTAGVLMLTWPIGADQFSNEKLLVDQLGVAVRAWEGGTRTVPDSARLASLLAESVSGTRPERVRVMELCDAASEAINGGSSSKDLDTFVKQLVEL